MTKFEYNKLFESFNEVEKKFAPKDLFTDGDFSLLFSGLKVSVVGSRKPTPSGIENAITVAKTLVKFGAIVVSGLAEGIDTVAHETAIQSNGKTIAVLGTSLDIAYPAKNENLLNSIKQNHLAVSQFGKNYPTRKENFPMRNRTMALLSDATIIIEASEKSGTRHQGWEALRLGRYVFILESLVKNPSVSWPKEMIKYGAQELDIQSLPFILDSISIITSRFEYA